MNPKSKTKGPNYFEVFVPWFVVFLVATIISLFKLRFTGDFKKFLFILILLKLYSLTPIIFYVKTGRLILLSRNNRLFTGLARDIFIKNSTYSHNLHMIPPTPTIWICNYPLDNVVEYFTQGLLPQTYRLVVNSNAKFFMSKIYSPDRTIFINIAGKNNYNALRNKIKETTEGGENVFMYFDTNKPKGERKRFDLGGVRNGAFNIARELGVAITPIVMDHLYISGGIIPPQRFEICVGESRCIRSKVDIDELLQFYKKTLNRFLSQKFKNLK